MGINQLEPPDVSKVLALFILAELGKCPDGTQITLGSTNDSLKKMDEKAVADYIGDDFSTGVSYDDMRIELAGLVESHGANYEVGQINLEV